jgi:hypothetical protein
MPAPDPCVTLDSVTAQDIVQRSMRSSQVAADGYQFVSEQMRLGHQRSSDFASANAARVVLESGSGRTRNLDTTIAGQKVSGGA